MEIYLIRERRGKVIEESDTVLKETDKTYIVTDLGFKSRIPKSAINTPSAMYGLCSVYCLDPKEGKEVFRAYLDERIADKQESIENYRMLQQQCV